MVRNGTWLRHSRIKLLPSDSFLVHVFLYSEVVISRFPVVALIVACIVPAVAGQEQEQKFTVSGMGSYPISGNIESVWLAAPDHRPLLMVYFYGPEDWANRKWKIDS